MTALDTRAPAAAGAPAAPQPASAAPGVVHEPWCTSHYRSPYDADSDPGWCTHVVARVGVDMLHAEGLTVTALGDERIPEIRLDFDDSSGDDPRYGLTLAQSRALRAALEAAERLLEGQ